MTNEELNKYRAQGTKEVTTGAQNHTFTSRKEAESFIADADRSRLFMKNPWGDLITEEWNSQVQPTGKWFVSEFIPGQTTICKIESAA